MTSSLRVEAPSFADAKLSVVMPVYSETESVRGIVEWLVDQLGACLHEVILVLSPYSDDSSRGMCDRLARVDARVRIHVQRHNPGLGRAVREGIEQTRGDLVLLMDSDGEMEKETILPMLAEMNTGRHGLVIASRWCSGGGFVGYSPTKLVLNWCFQCLFRILFWTRLHDLTYGFKLMRGGVARGIAWEGTMHEIACETTLKPVWLGVSATEVPSRWTKRSQGQTKNTFVRNFRYLAMALRILVWGGATRRCDSNPAPGFAGVSRQGGSRREDVTLEPVGAFRSS
jgi:dolichol-phosphate mannosyltransferase